MFKATYAAVALVALAAIPGCGPAGDDPSGLYEVAGVEAGDMLKMRAGPGTGFDVIAGLPNGSVLRIYSCERTGGTRWCEASSKEARGLRGYVSFAYVRRM
jgi:uncharacterized protein YraI